MTSMPWVKIYTETLDDVKLARLTDQQKWRFVQLILLAAECDAAGALVTGDSRMTHEEIAWRLRCDIKTLREDIENLVTVGVITNENSIISVTKFSERQGPTQAEKREKWRSRQNNRRNRVKSENVTGDSRMTHADVTPLDKSREEEDISANAEQPPSASGNSSQPADPPAPKPAKARRAAADPRSKHPAILCARGVAGKYPPLEIYDDVIQILGDSPDGPKLAACHKEWFFRGYNPNSWNWLREWYVTGIPPNGKPKQQNQPQQSLESLGYNR